MKASCTINGALTRLHRGGYVLDTSAGRIQFGCPPETIKDTMTSPGGVPRIFVLPKKLFHNRKGISVAELEFPLYYNFFIKQQKSIIIGTKNQISRLIATLQESLFGPKSFDIANDYHNCSAGCSIPDIKPEMEYFGSNFTFDDLVEFRVIQNKNVKLDDIHINIDDNHNFIIDFDKQQAFIPGEVEYTSTYDIGQRLPEPYSPPLFAVTCLGPSHGFDPHQNTSGFIIWLNHNGIMVDPPVNSTEWLQDSNVNPKTIDSIILTHCHADHDAGTFQKIIEESKITVYATKTVMDSFMRKYSSLSGESEEQLRQLFKFHQIYIDQPTYIHGGEFNFFYSLHSIPTAGFTLHFQDQSFVYSSDHQGDPALQKKLLDDNVISKDRYDQLRNFPWDSKVIYHEAGIPPLHTPVKYLDSLSDEIKKKTVVYHIAKKDFPEDTHLTLATFGIKNTLYFPTRPPVYEKTYELLEVLKHLDFFNSLDISKIQQFVTIVEKEHYKKGDTIISRGTNGDRFYIIKQGNAIIKSEHMNLEKHVGSFEYFGEISLLNNMPRQADVIAETDVTAYTIEKNKFLSFISGTEFESTLKKLIQNRTAGVWDLLATNKIIQHLTSYQRTWLESIIEYYEVDGTGILIRENTPFEYIYLLLEGCVDVLQNGTPCGHLYPGDVVGCLDKVYKKEQARYTYTYTEPLKLFRVSYTDARNFIKKNPGISISMRYRFIED